MHAILYNRKKFLNPDTAQQAYNRAEEEDNKYGPIVYTRKLIGNEIIEMTYEEVYPYELDSMFRQQTESLDNKMATGAAKRTSKNGYDPRLDDEFEDNDE